MPQNPNFMSPTGGGGMGAGWGTALTDQFQQLGITDPFSSTNIQSALSSITGKDIPAGMAPTITQDQFKAMQFGTYRPMLGQQTQSLLGDLQSTLGGKAMKQAYGGFAGASGAGQVSQQARDVYGQKAGNVLQDIGRLQSEGKQGVSGILQAWRNTIQSVKF